MYINFFFLCVFFILKRFSVHYLCNPHPHPHRPHPPGQLGGWVMRVTISIGFYRRAFQMRRPRLQVEYNRAPRVTRWRDRSKSHSPNLRRTTPANASQPHLTLLLLPPVKIARQTAVGTRSFSFDTTNNKSHITITHEKNNNKSKNKCSIIVTLCECVCFFVSRVLLFLWWRIMIGCAETCESLSESPAMKGVHITSKGQKKWTQPDNTKKIL